MAEAQIADMNNVVSFNGSERAIDGAPTVQVILTSFTRLFREMNQLASHLQYCDLPASDKLLVVEHLANAANLTLETNRLYLLQLAAGYRRRED